MDLFVGDAVTIYISKSKLNVKDYIYIYEQIEKDIQDYEQTKQDR